MGQIARERGRSNSQEDHVDLSNVQRRLQEVIQLERKIEGCTGGGSHRQMLEQELDTKEREFAAEALCAMV